MKKEYEHYAEKRIKGRMGRLASFPLVEQHLKNKKVLDIGCSDGLYLELFSPESLGIEQIPRLVDSAKERGLNVVKGNVVDGLKELPDNSFDAVFYSHVMEHVDCPISTLREIHRVLRIDGSLILGLPIEKSFVRQLFSHDYFDGTHIYSFTVRNSKKLLEDTGFIVNSVVYHFPWLKGRFGEVVNVVWNAIPFPGKEWMSMAYWISAKKV